MAREIACIANDLGITWSRCESATFAIPWSSSPVVVRSASAATITSIRPHRSLARSCTISSISTLTNVVHTRPLHYFCAIFRVEGVNDVVILVIELW
jgi:hypothetical protein